jgi:hypothetical protein
MPVDSKTTRACEGRRTLIIGDVNSGKTHFTEQVLAAWTAQGRSRDIVVLDLAPEARRSIGGPLALPPDFAGIYLAAPIVPPRLQARNEEEAEALAQANARSIEHLFGHPGLATCSILVINDATLYLQAGHYDRLIAVLQPVETVLINAYYGESFPDYRLSRRERRLTDRLIQDCHRVIRLSGRHTSPHPI